MRVATWNVNSLKVRIGHVADWLASTKTDLLCLQELKTEETAFAEEALGSIGYGLLAFGQKTYNGVAIAFRRESARPEGPVERNIPSFDDAQARFIRSRFDTAAGVIDLASAYFPNGQEVGSEKFAYKLSWIRALRDHLSRTVGATPFCLAGDFNIAPEDADCWNPALWEGSILVSPEERAAFAGLLELGLTDAFRAFEQPPKSFSWWDYRMLGFQKNHGMRIDHLLVNAPLRERLGFASIDRAPRKLPKPSDHAPCVIGIDEPA